ncbi:MAG: MarR family transcriptional regulator [Candidatus Rickettsia vulgarisii]
MIELKETLCANLYIKSREIIRAYEKCLRSISLTYTQALVLILLNQKKSCYIYDLSQELSLDSGTLTPLLKKLLQRGLLEKNRDSKDERRIYITITQEGESILPYINTCFNDTAKKCHLKVESKKQLICLLNNLTIN